MSWYKDIDVEDICSFCGRNSSEFDLKLVRGFNSNICSDCIDKAYEAIKQSDKSNSLSQFDEDPPKPKEIKDFLDKYIVGQEDAKKFYQLLFIIIIKELLLAIMSEQIQNIKISNWKNPIYY